jgi:hypothetical protein
LGKFFYIASGWEHAQASSENFKTP